VNALAGWHGSCVLVNASVFDGAICSQSGKRKAPPHLHNCCVVPSTGHHHRLCCGLTTVSSRGEKSFGSVYLNQGHDLTGLTICFGSFGPLFV
jgi:hypothetical protein